MGDSHNIGNGKGCGVPNQHHGRRHSQPESMSAMDQQPSWKPSMRQEAVAALLAVGAGVGIGYGLYLATNNIALGIVSASAIAHLANNFVRNVIRKG